MREWICWARRRIESVERRKGLRTVRKGRDNILSECGFANFEENTRCWEWGVLKLFNTRVNLLGKEMNWKCRETEGIGNCRKRKRQHFARVRICKCWRKEKVLRMGKGWLSCSKRKIICWGRGEIERVKERKGLKTVRKGRDCFVRLWV